MLNNFQDQRAFERKINEKTSKQNGMNKRCNHNIVINILFYYLRYIL